MEAKYASSLFVGRQKESQDFQTWLDNPNAPPVRFYVAGGGMGKTWLLKALKQTLYCREEDRLLAVPRDPIPEDFTNITVLDLVDAQQHSIDNLQETIANSLEDTRFENYRVAQNRFEVETSQTNSVREALYSYVRTQFLADLKDLCQTHQVILFFDTFERVYWEEVGYWLTYVLPHNVPGLRVVIAGRPLVGGKRDFGKYVDLVSLGKFEETDDITRFFRTREAIDRIYEGEEDESQSGMLVRDIAKKFEGVPLRLELAALLLAEGTVYVQQLISMPQVEIERSLIKYLHSLTNPVTFQVGERVYSVYDIILKMSYLNRRFNGQFVAPIYEIDFHDADQVLQAFFDYFPYRQSHFVKQLGDRLQLHDEMERLVRKYGWELHYQSSDSTDEEQNLLAEEAIQVYDALIQEAVDDIERAELEAEQLDYLLRANRQKGYKRFRTLFDSRMEALQLGLCTMLAAEIRSYEAEYELDTRFNIGSRLAWLSFRLGNLEAAQAEWKKIRSLNLSPEQQVEVLIGLHNSTWRQDIQQSESYLKQALRICQRQSLPLEQLGHVQQLLGFTYTHVGETKRAIRWYDKCIQTAHQIGREGARLYAEAQNSRGFCYALLGEFKKAEAQVWDALTLRRKRGWVAEVGRSYNTRAEVARLQGDFRLADGFYNKAVHIFRNINDQEWLALVLHARGQNTRLRARKDLKHGEVEQANEWLSQAYNDLEESCTKYEYYNLTRQRSQMLRRFGRVLKDQEEWARAREVTLQSLSLAQRNENTLEQLKSVIALSRIAAQMGNAEDMKSFLVQVEQLGRDLIGRQVFLGLAHLTHGAYYYQQQQWTEAFTEISAGLVALGHAGGRGRLYFHSYHDQLQVQLSGLPNIATKRDWCDRLIEIWKREKLDREFPEIIHLCEGYSNSLEFL